MCCTFQETHLSTHRRLRGHTVLRALTSCKRGTYSTGCARCMSQPSTSSSRNRQHLRPPILKPRNRPARASLRIVPSLQRARAAAPRTSSHGDAGPPSGISILAMTRISPGRRAFRRPFEAPHPSLVVGSLPCRPAQGTVRREGPAVPAQHPRTVVSAWPASPLWPPAGDIGRYRNRFDAAPGSPHRTVDRRTARTRRSVLVRRI